MRFEDLWSVVSAEVGATGMPITGPCLGHLSDFIRNGTRSILPLDQAKVEQNLARFIQEMARQAQAAGQNELHENSFFGAKSALCPLWPFC